MELPERFSAAFDGLHRAAAAQADYEDFGPADYHEPLRLLLECLDRMPHLTDMGRRFAFGMLSGVLAARLHTQRGWSANPRYREVAIRAPLIITGIPRTGTTALHKLLSLDPQFQGIERWLAAAPMVRPPRGQWQDRPEYRACVAGLEAVVQVAPSLLQMHDMTADTVDECLEILQQSFVSNMYASTFDVPDYTDWLLRQSEAASYRRYADVLRLIGLADQDKRWLLKNPGHTWELETLLDVFPDACVVQTHRTPLKAIPSLCSVLRVSRGIYQGEQVRPERIGPAEVRKWRRALDRTEAARRRRPDRVFDVDHQRFHADPLGVIRSIYERFGLHLHDGTADAMRRWLEQQPAEQKNAHRYTAASFGLSEPALREQFADYIERYDLQENGR